MTTSAASRRERRLALGALAIGGLALAVWVLLFGPWILHSGVRPTEVPHAAYELVYVARPGAEPVRIQVDADERACDDLKESLRIRRICTLATSLGAMNIAGEAFGRLNDEDTDAFEAIKWRARLLGSVEFCADAGLLDERLRACQDAVEAPTYEFEDAGAIVGIGTPASND